MPTRIESPQNPRIKNLLKLTKRRRRDKLRLTVVEGVREAVRALRCGILPVEAYICPKHARGELACDVVRQLTALQREGRCQLFHVTPELYERIAYRGESGGLLLIIPYLPLSIEHLPIPQNPFFVVVENVEKPGNLGAILRSADAAGVDGLLVVNSRRTSPTDAHNPNVIRASLGTLFSVPTAVESTSQALIWLRQNNINIVASSPQSQTCYAAADFRGPIAIVMGSEATGLSSGWLEVAAVQVKIPMYGVADSLNLAASTAILLYEVVRQRRLSNAS